MMSNKNVCEDDDMLRLYEAKLELESAKLKAEKERVKLRAEIDKLREYALTVTCLISFEHEENKRLLRIGDLVYHARKDKAILNSIIEIIKEAKDYDEIQQRIDEVVCEFLCSINEEESGSKEECDFCHGSGGVPPEMVCSHCAGNGYSAKQYEINA